MSGSEMDIEKIAGQLSRHGVSPVPRPCEPKLPESVPKPFRRVEDIPSIWDIEVPPQSWLVDGLIPAEAITLITGASGVGKSMITLSMAGSIASGRRFAGRQCLKSPVLVLDRENPASVVKGRIDMFRIERSDDFNCWGMWIAAPPEIPCDPVLSEFAHRRGVLIVDSLVAFHTGSEQDATETRSFLHHLRHLAARGATVILLHHTGKGENSRDYRGSSDIPAAVDAAFAVERSEGSAGIERLTLRCFKMRMTEAPARLVLEWREPRFEASEDSFAIEGAKAMDALIDIIRSNPSISRTAAADELRKATGIARNRARGIVDSAVTGGELIAEKGGPGGGERLRIASLIEV